MAASRISSITMGHFSSKRIIILLDIFWTCIWWLLLSIRYLKVFWFKKKKVYDFIEFLSICLHASSKPSNRIVFNAFLRVKYTRSILVPWNETNFDNVQNTNQTHECFTWKLTVVIKHSKRSRLLADSRMRSFVRARIYISIHSSLSSYFQFKLISIIVYQPSAIKTSIVYKVCNIKFTNSVSNSWTL